MKKQILYSFLLGIGFLTACAQGPVSESGTGANVANPQASDIIKVIEYRLDHPFDGKEIPFGDKAENFHYFQNRNIHRGRSIPVRIEFENKSDYSVTIDKMHLTGADASHFSIENSAFISQVAAHQKTYIDLYFVPKQTGSKQAQIEFYVTSSQDQSPRYFYFTMGGMGTNQNLYVSPFGNDNNHGDETHPKRTIQNAIDTLAKQINVVEPIDTILVEAGEYEEQLILRSSLGIIGNPDAKNRTVIKAPDPLDRIPTADGQKDIISISGDGNAQTIQAEIAFLTVSGPVSGQEGCQPLEQGGNILSGIRVRDGAFAYLHENIISKVRAEEMQGCQNGIGILVGHSRHEDRDEQRTSGFAVVLGNELLDYQKAGIAVVGQGSLATILNNTVQGYKKRPQIAQNGIQMSLGAYGLIEGNYVIDNQCEQTSLDPNAKHCGPDPYNDWQASGILLSEYSQPIVVRGNLVTDNDLGFATQIASAPLTNQKVVSVENNYFIRNRRVNAYIEQSNLLFSQNQIDGEQQAAQTPWGILILTDKQRLDQKILFVHNEIVNNAIGIEVNDVEEIAAGSQNAPVVVLAENNIMENVSVRAGSPKIGVKNLSKQFVYARNNYWGSIDGPSSFLGSIATGQGDGVSQNVIFDFFAKTKFVWMAIP